MEINDIDPNIAAYLEVSFRTIFNRFPFKRTEGCFEMTDQANKQDVKNLNNLYKCFALSVGYYENGDLELQKKFGCGSISRMVH